MKHSLRRVKKHEYLDNADYMRYNSAVVPLDDTAMQNRDVRVFYIRKHVMSDTKKQLFTDSGKGHYLIKYLWCMLITFLVGCGITFYILILAVPLAVFIWTMVKAIGKNDIYIYDDGIEGCGFKKGSLIPKLHNFDLSYNEIKHVKKQYMGLVIHSTKGRYNLIVHNPEKCVEKMLLNATKRDE
jgi:hypothetical protein